MKLESAVPRFSDSALIALVLFAVAVVVIVMLIAVLLLILAVVGAAMLV